MKYHKYFKNNYNDCRNNFKEILEPYLAKYSSSKCFSFKIPSKKDDDLYTDVAFFSSGDNNKLLIVSSGLHGIETYIGSALQQYFIEKWLDSVLEKKISVLFINCINPYGCKYYKRNTENNVDLNRNFDINDSLFKSINPGYEELDHIINPAKPLDYSFFNSITLFLKILLSLYTCRKYKLGQVIPQGQYKNNKGIFFGGHKFEIHVKRLSKIFRILKNFKTIISVDLHSGVGKKNKMHLVGLPTMSCNLHQHIISKVFKNLDYECENSRIHKETGSYLEYIFKLLDKNQIYIPVLLEFGTLGEGFINQFKTLKTTIYDNCSNFYGFKKQSGEKNLFNDNLQLYYPNDNDWKINAIEQFDIFLKTFINRVTDL